MKQKVLRKTVRGVPSSSTTGKQVWLRSGWYWATAGRLTPLLTKSCSILSDRWFQIGAESPVDWKKNKTKKDRKDQSRLIRIHGPITSPL